MNQEFLKIFIALEKYQNKIEIDLIKFYELLENKLFYTIKIVNTNKKAY